MVHRDIKPSNLLITPAGQVKLIDMGLARLRETDPRVADLTASGVTLGTFDYISPEQARDPRNADVRSDIYSLGCTLFYMLAGRPPFVGGTMLQKLLQHQADQPPDVGEFRRDLPEELSRILRQDAGQGPAHRWQTPGELVDQLYLLASSAGWRRPAWGGRARGLAPGLYRHLPWIVPLAALLGISWSWTGYGRPRTLPTIPRRSCRPSPRRTACLAPRPGRRKVKGEGGRRARRDRAGAERAYRRGVGRRRSVGRRA